MTTFISPLCTPLRLHWPTLLCIIFAMFIYFFYIPDTTFIISLPNQLASLLSIFLMPHQFILLCTLNSFIMSLLHMINWKYLYEVSHFTILVCIIIYFRQRNLIIWIFKGSLWKVLVKLFGNKLRILMSRESDKN